MNPDIQCKRQIVLKSIVTDAFKVDLASDLKQGMEGIKGQISQLNGVINQQKGQGHDISPLENELKKAYVQIKMLEKRLDEVQFLKNGDLYTTGTFEAYSSLKKGDDIRDKLGSVEVICKDYIVQEINTPKKKK